MRTDGTSAVAMTGGGFTLTLTPIMPGRATASTLNSGSRGVCLTAPFGRFRLPWLPQHRSSPRPGSREWKEVP
jgi:hypothetical protein